MTPLEHLLDIAQLGSGDGRAIEGDRQILSLSGDEKAGGAAGKVKPRLDERITQRGDRCQQPIEPVRHGDFSAEILSFLACAKSGSEQYRQQQHHERGRAYQKKVGRLQLAAKFAGLVAWWTISSVPTLRSHKCCGTVRIMHANDDYLVVRCGLFLELGNIADVELDRLFQLVS
jgi:hypothetical protein